MKLKVNYTIKNKNVVYAIAMFIYMNYIAFNI